MRIGLHFCICNIFTASLKGCSAATVYFTVRLVVIPPPPFFFSFPSLDALLFCSPLLFFHTSCSVSYHVCFLVNGLTFRWVITDCNKTSEDSYSYILQPGCQIHCWVWSRTMLERISSHFHGHLGCPKSMAAQRNESWGSHMPPAPTIPPIHSHQSLR